METARVKQIHCKQGDTPSKIHTSAPGLHYRTQEQRSQIQASIPLGGEPCPGLTVHHTCVRYTASSSSLSPIIVGSVPHT
ncbi:hypothetical protein GDO81_012653 [Engystomops pustulosus]|uniref:Uncharacterized protein n=1 Tax=Engystomops pustulosus TaxID=76066 RepID=A0AAV7AUT9_ENGPU|nr:hypothetical protein GDO81_012653 [Engystomops pustulosus]